MKMLVQMISKHFWVVALVALTLVAPQQAYALSVAVQQVQGEVSVQKAGAAADAWQIITADAVLESGDSLKTTNGTCALVYSDQATFLVEANTSLTIEERPTAQDIKLLLGKIKGKIDKNRAEQPFTVTTPAAVASVRGTEVDFSFNDEGDLAVDLHNGKIDVINDDAEMKLELEGKKSITVKFDKEANLIRVKNDCGSDGPVTFSVLGASYSGNPCEEKEVTLSTSSEGQTVPETDPTQIITENIDEGREPISEVNNA